MQDKGFLVEVVVSSFEGVVHKRVESIDLKTFKDVEAAKEYATKVSETMYAIDKTGLF